MATGVGQQDVTNPLYNAVESVLTNDTVVNAKNALRDAVNSIGNPETQKQGDAHRADQKNYDYSFLQLQYPEDLANGSRHPYWMTFYVNTQDLSEFKRPPSNGPAPLSTVEINARETRNLNKNFGSTNLGFGRKTHRTSMAIRLYMPDTLSWSFGNEFRDAKLSSIPGSGIAQSLATAPKFADSLVKNYQKGGISGILASLDSKEGRGTGAPLLEAIGDLTGVGGDLAVQVLGLSINPQVDVLYQSPTLRQFNFDFLFAPRNQKEASQVSEIIKQFKFHAAPEIYGPDGGVGLGRYFVPPSEFDIEFSVTTMGKISTCVLQNITVDYAPSGTAFYGADDQPVNTRLTLQFKELEFITKNLVSKGY
jgi:hypothetical protein